MVMTTSSTSIILTILILCIAWLAIKLYPIYRLLREQRKALEKLANIGYNHWLLGSIPKLKGGAFIHVARKIAQDGHKVFGVWRTCLQGAICLVHPDTAQQLLKGNEPKGTKMKAGYQLVEPWIGLGLVTSNGPKWERNRKLLTPGFHFSVLKSYMRIFNEAADMLLKNLETQCVTHESLDISDLVTLCTLDILLQCAFSYKGGIQETGNLHPYARSVKRLAKLLIHRLSNPLVLMDTIYRMTSEGREFKQLCNYVHAFAEAIIETRREALEVDPALTEKRHLDFLDILLTAKDEDGFGLSLLEIRSEVDTFLFAGHDTTSSAIMWLIYALGRHPEMQEHVRQEVESVSQTREHVEWDDLGKLVYSTKFIREVLRFHVPVPAILRQLTKPTSIDGVVIPAETLVFISIYAMHHNPCVWKDPEVFNPERFDTDNFAERHPYLFVPFSAGPRNCLGQNFALQEIKVMLCHIVKRFTVEADPKHVPELNPELVMRSKNGIRVKLKQRL